MDIYKLNQIYNELLSCSLDFFASLDEKELAICTKIGDYVQGTKEDIAEKDLNTIQKRQDNFKAREWKGGESKIPTQTLKTLYQKFHPTVITVSDLPSEILRQHILPQAAEPQASRVSHKWNTPTHGTSCRNWGPVCIAKA